MDQKKILFTITYDNAGNRLDRFLTLQLEPVSRSQIQKIIENGLVLVNGMRADKKKQLTIGDVVEVSMASAVNGEKRPIEAQAMDFDIVYEDEYLVVINKPAGLVVHPGNGVPDGTVVNGLVYKFNELSDGSEPDRPGIVHRLDKNTSGILIVAKNNTIHAALSSQFAQRTIKKEYVAFCIGSYPGIEGVIDAPLARSKRDPVKRAIVADGKHAVTNYSCLAHKNGIALMRFFPHTGRTHQIRVHSSSRGIPIVMDDLYGGKKERIQLLSPLDRTFATLVFKCFSRHALHAEKICFTHPKTGKHLSLKASIPVDFRDAVRVFGEPLL